MALSASGGVARTGSLCTPWLDTSKDTGCILDDVITMSSVTLYRYSVTGVSVHPSGKLALSVGKDRTVR